MAGGHPNVKNRKQEVQEVYLRDAYVYLFFTVYLLSYQSQNLIRVFIVLKLAFYK